jgi:hypothetical protein
VKSKGAQIAVFACLCAPLPGCDVLALLEPPSLPGPAFIVVLPERDPGWVCVDFGIEGAPSLQREGEAWVIDATSQSVIQTSTNPAGLLTVFPRDVYRVVDGQRVSLGYSAPLRKATADIDTNSPISRHCLFYGTEEAAAVAGDPPELSRPDDPCCSADRRETSRQ